MWSLNNQTPFSAERGWIRDSNGAEVWIVAVKATWDIQPDGTTMLSSNQLPINCGPVMHPERDELLYDTDLGPEKQSTDIILNGHAWAPAGKLVTSLAVGCKIGSLCRLAYVYGDRLRNAKTYNDPLAFDKIPLSYSRMAAGSKVVDGYFNPPGIATELNEKPEYLPNIEFIGGGDNEIGFGPLARHWPARLRYAGTYDQHWLDTRSPLLPEDLDPRFWQTAPASQYSLGQLNGGEVVTLANMTPPAFSDSRILSFAIPKISLGLKTRFLDGSSQTHRARLHTVIIEPDFPRVSVVWHSALPCHRLVNQLDTTFITEKKRLMVRINPLPTRFVEWERL